MALASGSHLGPYEIIAVLVVSEVGEVYRARDPRLGREVAIRVLTPSAARSPGLARHVEHAARAIAALNHPNILTVFDVGQAPCDAAGTMSPYVVCELLDGCTLAELLKTNPPSLRRAVDMAAQLARALAAAHKLGVVSSDLRPVNIFITSDGRPKILDLGVAATEVPTTDMPTSASGTVVPAGDACYRSPEQVRGRALDGRSDVFSLGAVLYELATGARAFQKGTTTETLAAILDEEPKGLDPESGLIQPKLRRIISRCLEKDPAARFQSADDLAFALDALREDTGSDVRLTPSPQGEVVPRVQAFAALPGRRLGVYQIVGPLGAGGMGEVYRATDTKLDRDVALKVLPESFTHDGSRVARFRREAQILASLNHPNIAQIYGLEDASGVTALVLELVEGPTLADRIADGPLPFAEARPLARQIAEALEAAHERGVVHRDLKPLNIKVRPDGTAKVLDFGLAKAIDAAQSDANLSQTPTRTSPGATAAGVILGTAAYMSPEQARGNPVDQRADIWAFGCVLYEMLTGRLAFPGYTISDTIAAILTQEPDWKALPASVPPRIRLLLRRCLDRDAKRRLRDIGEARIELDQTHKRRRSTN